MKGLIEDRKRRLSFLEECGQNQPSCADTQELPIFSTQEWRKVPNFLPDNWYLGDD